MITKALTKKKFVIFLTGFLLLLFFLQAATSILKRSNTWDESGHLLSGYAYLKNGIDYLEPSHPVLGRLIPAIPLLFFDLKFEPNNISAQNAPWSNFYPYSLKFLFENNTDGKKLLFYSRLCIIMLGIILGIHIFIWGRMLYGNKGGLLSIFLYVLCPNILAHSGLVTTDFPLTVFFFLSLFYLYLLSDKITILRTVLAGISLGLALAAKYSALLLSLPYMAAFLYIFLKKDIGISNGLSVYKKNILIPVIFVLIFLTSYITIWSIYGFDYRANILDTKSEQEIEDTILKWEENRTKSVVLNKALDSVRYFHILPESYIYGLYRFLSRASEGHAAFLMGDYSSQGWWYYFSVAFLIKTPIPVLYLFFAALLFIWKYQNRAVSIIFLILPVILIFLTSLTQHINIGLRHILPIYPFIFMLIGGLVNIPFKNKKLSGWILSLFLAWSVWGAVNIYPYHLAYFNEFIGGTKNGYKYLVDSNLDWGQDLIGLKEYMDKNNIKEIKLAYFGFSDPSYYGIRYEYLPSYSIPNQKMADYTVPLQGYFAISATMLQGVYLSDKNFYGLFKEITPIDTIGHSIFIYKF